MNRTPAEVATGADSFIAGAHDPLAASVTTSANVARSRIDHDNIDTGD